MSDSLKHLIARLKQTNIIKSEPLYSKTLSSIDELANNDFDKAYLLGHFFKYTLDSDNLPSAEKNLLIHTIKSKKLDSYFYLKTKPDKDSFGNLIYLFLLIGIIAITAGTIQLSNGEFSYSLGTKYLVPIVREGGYKIILGFIFLTGGFIRIRREIKRKDLFTSIFRSPQNNHT